MPTAVSGFRIANGEFYETKEEANYEETKLQLINEAESAVQVTKQNLPAFMDFIEDNATLVRNHCVNFIALQLEMQKEFTSQKDAELVEMQKDKQI